MMYNSFKKLLKIVGVMVFFMGCFSWWQEWTEIILNNNTTTNSSYNLNTNTNTQNPGSNPVVMQDKSLETPDTWVSPKKLCISTASEKARVGNDSVGICDCPDWTKRIDKEWCVSCSKEWVCCGIQLNTNVPFIGNCIELSKWSSESESNDPNESKVTEKTAFPVLMGGLTKILVTIIILMWFIGILAGGVMISASWGDETRATEGKKLIGKVVIALALLGASGVILRLINPNFFG